MSLDRDTLRVPVLYDWDYYAGRLCGRVKGHPYFAKGKRITTTTVEHIDVHTGYAVTTSGSQYHLDWPDMDYLRLALKGLAGKAAWPPSGIKEDG